MFIEKEATFLQKVLREMDADSLPIFSEGITLLLCRWWALRPAVENEWSDRESCRKVQHLAVDVLSWFTQSQEPPDIDDLKLMLHDSMLSLNIEVDVGSTKEVSKKLMIMYEECLKGDFKSIETLWKASKRFQ